MSRFSLLLFMVFPLISLANFLPEGEFTTAKTNREGLPSGWEVSPYALRTRVSMTSVEKETVVRIGNSDAAQAIYLGRLLRLQPEWRRLRTSVVFCAPELKPGAEPWNTARVSLTFLDAGGKVIGYGNAPELKTASPQFQKVVTESPVPTGAASVRFQVGLFKACGVLLVKSISVDALDQKLLPVASDTDVLCWGKEPVIEQGGVRGEIVLNGIWRFAPGERDGSADGSAEWGLCRVPGLWHADYWGRPECAVIASGNGPAWKNLALNRLDRARFRRSITLPETWKNRRIFLRLERVSTDAELRVDGEYAGKIDWPGGELDITPFLEAGKRAELELLVTASGGGRNEVVLDAGHSVEVDRPLAARGIPGDVLLVSRPGGIHIDGVFIRTDTRSKQISVDVEITGVEKSGPAQFHFRILDAAGRCVKEFSGERSLNRGGLQSVTLADHWENPILWDVGQPYLYTLESVLRIDGVTRDVFRERFGFRDIRIAGRDFLLNGKKIRFRPTLPFHEVAVGGFRSAIAAQIDGFLASHFNLAELWPNDHYERGRIIARKAWADIADEKGFLLMYPAHTATAYVRQWKSPAVKERWRRELVRQWKEIRNNPSVILLAATPNRYAHIDDQNPRRIGNRRALEGDAAWQRFTAPAREQLQVIRAMDPSRPVAMHSGANLGDFQACNFYLNLLPLQEREEWFRFWVKSGDMPFMAVEFGTPFSYNFFRGRNGAFGAPASEPLLTEFCAASLGEKAYELERPQYRKMIRSFFVEKQQYRWMQSHPEIVYAPAALELQSLFIRNTLRSFRSWGVSGGVIPWEWGAGWQMKSGRRPLPAFRPGDRGWFQREADLFIFGLKDGAEITLPGCELQAVNTPLLMYIAGEIHSFTEKGHHYYSGEKLCKSIALCNDERSKQEYRLSFEIVVNGKTIADGRLTGSVPVGESILLPLETELPETAARTSGVIRVKGKFGKGDVFDEFHFSVYPVIREKMANEVLLFDPRAAVRRDFLRLNIPFREWKGEAAAGNVLVVAQGALNEPLPGALDGFVRSGGRLLILGQTGDVLMDAGKFRISRHVSRRFWPVATQRNHPILSGIDAGELCNWRGAGTLLPEESGTSIAWPKASLPFGWHVSNQGSVASIAVEKPHHGSWTPLLEGEFDLAYTPLMEKTLGSGRVIYCSLDLTERTQPDPVADRFLLRILHYLATAPVARPGMRASYIGGEKGAKLLTEMEVDFTIADRLPESGLVILGEGNRVRDIELEQFLQSGGRVILIERGSVPERFGFRLEKSQFSNRMKIPDWPEVAGCSVSEFRSRTDVDAMLFRSDCPLLQRYRAGNGSAVALALLPDELAVEKNTYLRFTSWRLRRLLAQLIANSGGRFLREDALLNGGTRGPASLPLAGTWRMMVTHPLSKAQTPQQAHEDPGDAGLAKGFAQGGFDDSTWRKISLPGKIEDLGGELAEFDGVFWVRRKVWIPAQWLGEEIVLDLGVVDDCDVTFWNGRKIGETSKKTPHFWELKRSYPVPGEWIRFGEWNTIAIRIFDHFGSGGIVTTPDQFRVRRVIRDVYDPDYRRDHELGDDPFRYLRW